MINTDKDALLCDLAETYSIYDIKAHPVTRVALFSVGLRDDSRIKMKMSGSRITSDLILLASAVDRLSLLVWGNTEDGQKGRNKPMSILDALLNPEKKEEYKGFETGADFMAYWNAHK